MATESTIPQEWLSPYGDSGVRVPFTHGASCLHLSAHTYSDGWGMYRLSCTRNAGHTGRHCAYSVTGRVLGVWVN